MVELPKRRRNAQQIIKKDYSYSEIINNNIDIKEINAIVFSVSDLANDMTKLRQLLSLSSDRL